MKTLEELVQQFADGVMAQKQALATGTAREGNRHAKRYTGVVKELWARGTEGRDALAVLLDDERPDVRCMAAAFLLKYCTERAKNVLEEVAKGQGLAAFGAAQCLERWAEGEWHDLPE